MTVPFGLTIFTFSKMIGSSFLSDTGSLLFFHLSSFSFCKEKQNDMRVKTRVIIPRENSYRALHNAVINLKSLKDTAKDQYSKLVLH